MQEVSVVVKFVARIRGNKATNKLYCDEASKTMNSQTNHQHTDEKAPPAGLVKMIMGVRNFLEKLRRNLVPPPIALLEMIIGYWYTQTIYVAAKLGIAAN
ncbi:MAG: hypothetical protein ACRENG_12840 [bacterium]